MDKETLHPLASCTPPLHVWVLAPYFPHPDDHIAYYYDFTQSIAEYEKTFNLLGLAWRWQPVTMDDYTEVIGQIVAEQITGLSRPVVFNLCDGDEINGTPGISVVRLLEQHNLVYTGADAYFYDITTSKIPMKEAFNQAGVPTAPWKSIFDPAAPLEDVIPVTGLPLIVKPSVSGGSMGIGIKNVVHDISGLREIVSAMYSGYRGWNLTADGIIAESFITGQEYTVLISGSWHHPQYAHVYHPVERVFHPAVPDHEKFLSFDRLWETYEEESPMPDQGHFYSYALPDPARVEEIKKISWEAYVATRGTGYTRVDIRMDQRTGQLYVLEVNAQCGLSEDEDYTSIGAILRLSGCTFAALVQEIIGDALRRRGLITS